MKLPVLKKVKAGAVGGGATAAIVALLVAGQTGNWEEVLATLLVLLVPVLAQAGVAYAKREPLLADLLERLEQIEIEGEAE